MMQLKIIDIEFSVCKVEDYSGIDLNQDTCLAESGIGIFAISTFNTDYILTKTENFERALKALTKSGYTIK